MITKATIKNVFEWMLIIFIIYTSGVGTTLLFGSIGTILGAYSSSELQIGALCLGAPVGIIYVFLGSGFSEE